MTQENNGGCVRDCAGLLQLGGLGRKPTVISVIPGFLKTLTGVELGGVDDMACQQQTELSYAWEKYMDYRLQGADLQVGAADQVWLMIRIQVFIFQR